MRARYAKCVQKNAYIIHYRISIIQVRDQMVTAATRIQSVSRSDGGSAPRDDLYSPERQRRPGQLDEPQRLIPSEDPVS